MLLGMAKSAKDDFLCILKSPYSDTAGVQAARRGLRELRDVVSKSEVETKVALLRGLSKDVFSKGRGSLKLNDGTNASEADLKCSVDDGNSLSQKASKIGNNPAVKASPSRELGEDYVQVALEAQSNSNKPLVSRVTNSAACRLGFRDKQLIHRLYSLLLMVEYASIMELQAKDNEMLSLSLDDTKSALIDLLDVYTVSQCNNHM